MKKLFPLLLFIWMMNAEIAFAQTSLVKTKDFTFSDGTERISIQGGGGLPSFMFLALLFRTENDIRLGFGGLIKSEDYKIKEFPETRMKTWDLFVDIRPQEVNLIVRAIGGGIFLGKFVRQENENGNIPYHFGMYANMILHTLNFSAGSITIGLMPLLSCSTNNKDQNGLSYESDQTTDVEYLFLAVTRISIWRAKKYTPA